MNKLFNLFKKSYVFLIIPLGLILFGVTIHRINKPIFYSYYDPDYFYLFNALSIYSGEAPSYTDHPGTTLQSLIALYFLIRERAIASLDLYYLVIEDPEKYLTEINFFILLFLSICNFLLGLFINKTFKSITLGILSQLMIFMSPGTTISLSRVNPDPLLYGLSILIFLPALIFIQKLPFRLVPSFKFSALLLGISFATKLTMLPFLAVTTFFIRKIIDVKNWVFYIFLGTIIGTIVWILNWKNYYYILIWIYNLILGSGLYGSGNRDIFNIAESLPKFLSLISHEIFFSIIYFLTFIFLLFSKFLKKILFIEPEIFKLLITIFLVQTLSLLIVLKHPLGQYSIPGEASRYLIPAASLVGFSLPVLLFFIFGKLKTFKKNVFYYFSLIVIIILITISQSLSLERIVSKRDDINKALAKRNQDLSLFFSNCIKIHRDDSTIEFAISQGLLWSRVKASIATNIDNLHLFKYAYFYNPATNKFYSASGKIIEIKNVIDQSNCVVLMDVMDLKKID